MSGDVRLRLSVPHDVRSVSLVGQIVRAVAVAAKPPGRFAADHVELAVSEGVANVVTHAGNRDRPLLVDVEYANGLLIVSIHDGGSGFSLPADVECPDPLAEHGRGLFLIRRLMDEVEYCRGDVDNVLRLVKRLA